MDIKRLHYFDHQFLIEADFTDEQQYHLDMRRRLNRTLHTYGIAEGLEVEKSGNKTVTVRPGMALDKLGREIILVAAQVVDLSNGNTFVPNTEVFVTIAYQEQQSDAKSAAGVSGNTRITEQPVIEAVTTQPPSEDGTVILLAVFTLNANADVPGPLGGLPDIAGRQMVGPSGGVLTVNGVRNPAGHVSLLPAQSIVIAANHAAGTITLGENHSSRTGNVHGLQGEDLQKLGVFLEKDYHLLRRAQGSVSFTGTDKDGATRQIKLDFQPRLVFVNGFCTATLGPTTTTRTYGGGVSAMADLDSKLVQCFGPIVTRNSLTDWSVSATTSDAIALGIFLSRDVTPNQGEIFTVSITEVLENGLTVTLSRSISSGAVTLPNFQIFLVLLCMG